MDGMVVVVVLMAIMMTNTSVTALCFVAEIFDDQKKKRRYRKKAMASKDIGDEEVRKLIINSASFSFDNAKFYHSTKMTSLS
jgi:hypothetical protein